MHETKKKWSIGNYHPTIIIRNEIKSTISITQHVISYTNYRLLIKKSE